MRLIDADELNKKAHICLTKDVAPTVEAIPMSVIEDIKAEIKEESRFCPLTEGLERALEIIDKYTAESEEV